MAYNRGAGGFQNNDFLAAAMGGMGGMMGGGVGGRRSFNKQYKCYSISMLQTGEKPEIEHSGKIVMPSVALEELMTMNIQYPMMFRITAKPGGTSSSSPRLSTHCGVAEFTAPPGKIYLPYWMMENLLIEQGAMVRVENVQPRKATFIKLQPQSVDFLDISDPKAVLERSLTGFTARSTDRDHGLPGFACVTKGDVLNIKYNRQIHKLLVQECKPDDVVSVIEADVNLDFSPPVGYVDPSIKHREEEAARKAKLEKEKQEKEENLKSTPASFRGTGFRLDGKNRGDAVNGVVQALVIPKSAAELAEAARALPFDRGTLSFPKAVDLPPPEDEKDEAEDGFKAFEGEGNKLKTRKGGK